ncbi:MAG: DUF2784 family protein [Proteobacteria bacterium]|nr:DUF2784 family protein [Pseudomonadota bacterium]
MFYKVAADFVIITHFMWILFVILGFPVFLYFNLSIWRLLHLAALIAAIIMQLTRTICPLTYLEAYLKSKDISGAVYPGAFIIAKIESIIYVEDLITLERITCLTLFFFIIVLLSFWFRPIKLKREKVKK